MCGYSFFYVTKIEDKKDSDDTFYCAIFPFSTKIFSVLPERYKNAVL